MKIFFAVLYAIFLAVVLARLPQAADSPISPGVAVSTSVSDFDDLDAPVQMIEAEFDPALLENLAQPTPPPARVALPRAIIGKGQWRGSLSGITRPAHVVIRDQALWDKFWAQAISPYIQGAQKVPQVDFSKDMVVGVFGGDNPYPNFQTEIRSIKPGSQGGTPVLIVRYRNVNRMQAVFSPPFNVQPFHLMKTRAFPGRVVFSGA